MTSHSLSDIGTSLAELILTESTTEAEQAASVRILGDFNGGMAGLLRFSGETPWERHPEDELLVVLDGEVHLTMLPENRPAVTETLRQHSLFLMRRGLWHRQRAESGVTLLFVAPKEGDDVSWAADPRQAPTADSSHETRGLCS